MPLSKKHLKQFLEYLRTEKNYSRHTLLAYAKDLRDFQEFFLKRNVTEARLDQAFGDQFRLFLQSLRSRQISNRSIARIQSALKSYFKHLFRLKLLSTDWRSRIKRVRYSRPLPEVPTESQVIAIVEHPTGDTLWELRDRAILELFYSAGLRLSELAGLNLANLDFRSAMARVLGKGKKERIVPIGKIALTCLQNYLHKKNELKKRFDIEAVFINRSGQRLTPRSLARIVKKHSCRSGIMDHFRPHQFRHAFGTHLLNGGADLSAVKELMGHKSLASTQIYTRVSLERLKMVYNKTHPRA